MTNGDTSARDAALLLIGVGRADEAMRKLRDRFDANDSWCWYARAAALLQLGRYDDCIEAAKEGLAVDAEHVHLLDVLAAARMQSANLSGAEEAILAALRLDAEDPDLLTRYAEIVARAGQMEKAEKLVARARAIDPENEYALQMQALLATASGDPRETLARSRELLRHLPENALAQRLIGATHAERGRMADADDAFTRAVILDPGDDGAAEAAREIRMYRHWALWPLRPAMRIGVVPMWITAVAFLLLLRAMELHAAAVWLSVVWVAYCVYTWIAPPIVRWLIRRRS